MNSSDQLNELAAALAKAQGAMKGALKDSANPFFKSKYADLESVWDACRKHLTDNGLSVAQFGEGLIKDGHTEAFLVTRLLHSSGQWIEGTMPIKAKDDSPQAQGSGITYARRYGLAAMVGVYQTDDDAEAAQGRHSEPERPNVHSPHLDTSHVPPELASQYAIDLRKHLKANDEPAVYRTYLDLEQEGTEKYDSNEAKDAVWKLMNPPERTRIKQIIAGQKGAR